MFNLNQIDENNIQVIGVINGSATRIELYGMKVWQFSISFFKGKVLHKVKTNPKDGTIWNLNKLKERINQAYLF